MLDSLQTSTLLSSSLTSSPTGNSSLANLFSSEEVTLATVTESLLNAHFNIEQPAATVAFSEELINFINDNLQGSEAEALLADIAAIEQLSNFGSNDNNSSVTSQLLDSNNSNILDLLI